MAGMFSQLNADNEHHVAPGGREASLIAKGISRVIQRRTCCGPTVWVFAGVVLGGLVGWFFFHQGWTDSTAAAVLAFPGKLWLKSLKCMVLPMIIFSMIGSMIMMRNLPGAKTLGLAVVGLYAMTTLFAAVEGVMVSVLFMGPTLGNFPLPNATNATVVSEGRKKLVKIGTLDTILNIFEQLIPTNLVLDASRGYLLPVIVASIVVGILVKDKKEDGSESTTIALINELNEVVIKVVSLIMFLTPVGVGSLVFASASTLDLSRIGGTVGIFMLAVLIGLCCHVFVVYTILLCVAGRNPARYFYKILPAIATVFGTASSAATLPFSISCAVEKNAIAPHIAKFVLSLGATINMDGTGLYLICCTYFLGFLEGVEFGFGKFFVLTVMATLCSMGAAPVPSASLVLLVTILTAVGVPDTHFGLITAVDWMLDRFRGIVNISGDATVAALINAGFSGEKDSDDSSDSD